MALLLETRDLKKHYRMGTSTVRALDGVSLSVQQGEFVALLGTSGSGKSTLLNLIAGLDRPTEGSLRIFDQDLARMSSGELSHHRRRNVGIIFQSFNLVSTMTARENVTLAMMFAGVPRAERETCAGQLLQSIGLGERQAHRPRELSGGEQQRVAIARALSNKPHLLLADEPTGNLDSRTSRRHPGPAERSQRARRQDDHHGHPRCVSGRRVCASNDHVARRNRRGRTRGVARMTFRDTLELALRNLGEAKLRTSLTTMGVSIGIASLAGMVSLGVGLQDQFVGRFTKSGLFDAITVTPGQDLPGFMSGGRGGRRGGFGSQRRTARGGPSASDVPLRADLNDETVKELAALGDVKEVYPSVRVPVEAKRAYNALVVKVKHAQNTQDVDNQIKKKGFSAFSLNDALRGAKRAFIILDIVLSLIGSIALAVSSLGIMNTMVMSILERTREIGIMKAIGGSDGDIRRIFLIEASAIGFFGGVAGVALGWIVGRLINFGANIYIQNQGGTPGNLFSLPFWLIDGAIGFSIGISLIAGSYPAARAARLDPIQALRHD